MRAVAGFWCYAVAVGIAAHASVVDVLGQAHESLPVSSYVYDGTGPGSQPSTSPAWPDSGGTELINETWPSAAHYTDSEWVGFQQALPDDGGSHPQVTFALADLFELGDIGIHYFHSTGQAGGSITAPESVWVSFSTNGTDFTAPEQFTAEFDHSGGDEVRVALLDVTGNDASHVRLDFRQASHWTFLTEVQFFAPGTNVMRFALQSAIAEAQSLHDAAVEGPANGEYPPGAKATLQAAIDDAQAVVDDPAATQAAVDDAEVALEQAVDTFRRSVNGGLPILHHILGTGQSLSVGWSGGPPLTTNQPYGNLMLSGVGQTGTDLVPLIEGPNLHGAEVETISSALANTLTALSPQTNYTSIVTRHGEGARSYAQLKKGTSWYAKGMDQVQKALAAAAAMGKDYQVVAVTTVHGESDHLGGNGAAYAGYLKEWQSDYDADVKALTGQTNDIPMFLCQMSSHTLYNMATSLLPGAQLWAAENSRWHTLVCPKYFLTYVDGAHLTAQSYRHLGEYYGKALKAVLVDGREWTPLTPARIVRDGTNITVDLHVPVSPIVIDTNAVLAQANFGFEYADDTSSASISSVSVLDADTIVVALDAVPTGAKPRLRYAHTGTSGSWAGWNQAGSARGNIRDSDATDSLYGNTLYNWLVHFDHPIPYDPDRDDFDGDGVPDRWEYLNFGDTNVSSGTSSNFDGDPMDDYAEWAAGTDPRDPLDSFQVRGQAAIGEDAFEVSWDTLFGRSYTLSATSNLVANSWSNVFTAAGNGSIITYISSGGVRRFFRAALTIEEE